MVLKVVFEPSHDARYTVCVPAVPGCISEADTPDDARQNTLDAIELHPEPAGEVAAPHDRVVEDLTFEVSRGPPS